jgi:hypothetical protein
VILITNLGKEKSCKAFIYVGIHVYFLLNPAEKFSYYFVDNNSASSFP